MDHQAIRLLVEPEHAPECVVFEGLELVVDRRFTVVTAIGDVGQKQLDFLGRE